MCPARNDISDIIPGIAFWAFDVFHDRRMDWTGYCICNEIKPWAIYATDIVGCKREFLTRRFRFEVL